MAESYRNARIPDGDEAIRITDGARDRQHAPDLVNDGLTKTIANNTVTYDLEGQMEGATLVFAARFGQEIARNS